MEEDPSKPGPVKASVASTRAVGIPLFHAAWLFALGIVIAHFVWLRPSYLLVALAPAAVLCGIAAFCAQRIAWLPMAALWCVLGAWCAEMQPQPAPQAQIASLSDGLARTVDGTIIDAGPVRSELEQNLDQNLQQAGEQEPIQRFDVQLSSIEVVSDTEDMQQSVQGGLRLNVSWPNEHSSPVGFRCGQRIRADVRLMQPQVYRVPGAWNRTEYLLDHGITSTASARADRVEVIGEEPRI